LGWCWTCGPKRTNRKFFDLYRTHIPNKLFHCVVSDANNNPVRNIPMDILQIIFDMDKKTFDEIIAEDLTKESIRPCFCEKKIQASGIILRGKNITNIKMIEQVINKEIILN